MVDLSNELAAWRDKTCRFNGTAWVFPDGVDFESLRLAVQAAWLAQDYRLALRFADQYDFVCIMCVRCTRHYGTEMNFEYPPTSPVPRVVWQALCEQCCCDLKGA